MTLKELISRLESLDPTVVLEHGFGKASSHRGDPLDIAFEPASDVSIGSMLQHAREAPGGSHAMCFYARSGSRGSLLDNRALQDLIDTRLE